MLAFRQPRKKTKKHTQMEPKQTPICSPLNPMRLFEEFSNENDEWLYNLESNQNNPLKDVLTLLGSKISNGDRSQLYKYIK